MQVGISTASFFQKLLTEDAFAFLNKEGIPCCEIFLASFSEYTQKFASLLRSRKTSTEVTSLHSLNQQFEPELFNRVERARKDSEKVLGKIGKAAKILHAKYYTFHGPAMLRRVSYDLDYERIGKRVEQLVAFLKQASGNKTQLCYENVHWCYFSNPDFITRIADYAPSVKCCLDVKQALQSGFEPEKYILTMGERLTNVHLCDYNNGKTALPGKGQVDFEKLFGTLIDRGYKGDAMIEVYSGDYNDLSELLTCYEYITKCLYRATRAGM